ncbi:MAG: hypothetical protein KAS32_12290 [Candidatus Peribacteraceae bacterium]|nr:hypothetical protein [Candidatus Peribacteraceae bacterium]
MKGYKVVNYDKWASLPEIFMDLKSAKEAKKNWPELGPRAIIEYFNSRGNRARVIKV